MADLLELTLLRHGRSRADDERKGSRRSLRQPADHPRRSSGPELAAYRRAHPPGFERVVCSSLVRARRTAEIVGAALGLEVAPDDAWREFDDGPVAGLPSEAEKRYPKPAFRGRFERFTVDGGESYAAFSRRINGALEVLVQSSANSVLVVAHGGSLNVALRDLLRAPAQAVAFDDTSFAEVTVSRDSDRVRLRSLGRTPHLEGD